MATFRFHRTVPIKDSKGVHLRNTVTIKGFTIPEHDGVIFVPTHPSLVFSHQNLWGFMIKKISTNALLSLYIAFSTVSFMGLQNLLTLTTTETLMALNISQLMRADNLNILLIEWWHPLQITNIITSTTSLKCMHLDRVTMLEIIYINLWWTCRWGWYQLVYTYDVILILQGQIFQISRLTFDWYNLFTLLTFKQHSPMIVTEAHH